MVSLLLYIQAFQLDQDTEKKESCRRDTHESDHQSKQPSSNDFLICVQCLSMVVRKLISGTQSWSRTFMSKI
jgi:hypothetical protein